MSNVDAIRMLELLAAARGTGEGAEDSDFSRAMKWMEMFMALQQFSSFQPGSPVHEPYMPYTGVDSYAQRLESRLRTPELQTIKAAIPYLENKYQKNVRLLVKLIEIQRLMEACRETAMEMRESGMEADGWRAAVLELAQPYLSPVNQLRVDMLIKVFEINRIMSQINDGRGYNGQ